MTKEVLTLALEALNKLTDVFLDTEGNHGDYEQKAINQGNKAITAIKEALDKKAENARELGLDYAPQRTWVGLTDEEKQEWIDAMPYDPEPRHCMILVNVIEAKLRSKNGY